MRQNLNNSSSILRLLLIGTGVVVITAGMKAFSEILSPVIMAFFLALICIPLYQWLQRKGLGSGLALLAMILLLLAVFAGLALLVFTSFRVMLDTVPEYTASMEGRISDLAANLSAVEGAEDGLTDAGETAVSLISSIAGSVLSNALTLVLTSVIILILLIFIIAESPRYPARFRRAMGADNDWGPRILELRTSIINYFVARIKVNSITGVGVLILLMIVGVDYALLWAVLAVFLSFIPYFGLILAAIPAVVLAFAQYGLTAAVIVAIGYLVINQVIEQIVAPKIIADDVNLSLVVTFFALFFWGWIFDFMGVILAAPLTVLIIMILQSYPETRWLAIMAVADGDNDDDEDGAE